LVPPEKLVNILLAVASAVEGNRWIMLDDEDRIVDASDDVEPIFGPLMGERFWDLFPNARAVFAPYCEEARRTGETVELVTFFEGALKRVRYAPHGAHVTATWEVLASVDVSSVKTLRDSLREIDDALADEDGETVSQPPALRVLQGGG
jgi:hypothetical protein